MMVDQGHRDANCDYGELYDIWSVVTIMVFCWLPEEYRGPCYKTDPKRDHNFDNPQSLQTPTTLASFLPSDSSLLGQNPNISFIKLNVPQYVPHMSSCVSVDLKFCEDALPQP